MPDPQPGFRWPSGVLVIAGIYNLTCSAWMGLTPVDSFAWSGLQDPDMPLNYPQLWQGLGMLVGVFGIGYLLAATDPVRHAGVVGLGLLSKVFGGLATVIAVVTSQSPTWALMVSFFNDMIWWIPFWLILRHAFLARRDAA